jgi:hypothetical protein
MEQMKTVIMRRAEDSGQRQLDNAIIALRAASYVRHMEANGVLPQDYNAVYELAVAIYNEQEIKGPFGVDFMVQAAKRLQEVKIGVKSYQKPTRRGLVSCTTCQGSKMSYKMDGDKIVGIHRDSDGKVVPCEDCK